MAVSSPPSQQTWTPTPPKSHESCSLVPPGAMAQNCPMLQIHLLGGQDTKGIRALAICLSTVAMTVTPVTHAFAWAAAPHGGSSAKAPFISWQDVWSSVPKSPLALPSHRLAGYCAAGEGTDRNKELSGGPECAPHQQDGSLAAQSNSGQSKQQA